MHNTTISQPCSPLTFTYTTRTQSQQTRSAHSSHTITSLQRINQIRPTSKITIPLKKYPKTIQKSEPSSANPKIYQTPSTKVEEPSSPMRTAVQVVPQTLNYGNIKNKSKPFKWNKFTLICGSDMRPLGENGCLCPSQPCHWKKQWTKSQCKKDHQTFIILTKQSPSAEYLTQIEKDLLRTYPECPTFATNSHFLSMLKTVLTTYAAYDLTLGYVQGLNMLAAVLLYHIKNPNQTFWALVQLMENQQLRMVYLDHFVHLKTHQSQIMTLVQTKIPDLYALIIDFDIIPQCFLNGWLLSLMSNCIPIEHMPQVINKFMERGWRFIYQLVVAYLLYLKERLMLSGDQAQFLQYLSVQAAKQVGEEWGELVQNCCRVGLA